MDEELNFYEQLEECKEKLLILKTSEGVPLRIAQFFIEHSAYWNHPTAGWVQASKHSKRIEYGVFGYQLRFGGNYFLVSLAITRCVHAVTVLLDKIEQEYMDDEYIGFDYDELLTRLFLHVRGAVANTDGHEYKGYYPIHHGQDMVFGTQAINVRSFVGIVTATSKILKMNKF